MSTLLSVILSSIEFSLCSSKKLSKCFGVEMKCILGVDFTLMLNTS